MVFDLFLLNPRHTSSLRGTKALIEFLKASNDVSQSHHFGAETGSGAPSEVRTWCSNTKDRRLQETFFGGADAVSNHVVAGLDFLLQGNARMRS
jgi:hypothetical protein